MNISTAVLIAVLGVQSSHAFTCKPMRLCPVQRFTSGPTSLSAAPFFVSDTKEDIDVETLREQARALEEEAIALEQQALALEKEAIEEAVALELQALALEKEAMEVNTTLEAASALEEASETKVAPVPALEANDVSDTMTELGEMTDDTNNEEADGEVIRQKSESKQQVQDGIENRSARRMSLRERLRQIETKADVRASVANPSLSTSIDNPSSLIEQQQQVKKNEGRSSENENVVSKKPMSLREIAMLSSRR